MKQTELPAARMLRDSFVLKLSLLRDVKAKAREIKNAGKWSDATDPEAVLKEATVDVTPQGLIQLTQRPKLQLGQTPLGFPQPRERRVFIGTNYDTFSHLIPEMRTAVFLRGYIPVIVREVSFPPNQTRDVSLLLLHTCSFAVFDITDPGGQLMEIERARDYGVTTLLLRSQPTGHPPYISQMIQSTGFRVDTYRDPQELRNRIGNFLPLRRTITKISDHYNAQQMIDTPRSVDLSKRVSRDYESLWQFRKNFEQRSFATKDETAIELSLGWDPDFLPNFEYRDGALTSRQDDFFGTFLLGEAIAEFLKGVEGLGAYALLDASEHDPLANIAAYTSAFHLLDSFLCLNGSLFLHSPTGGTAWRFHRFLPQKGYETIPTLKLAPDGLLRPNGNRVNWLRVTLHPNKGWTYEPEDVRSVHRTKWRIFGKILLQKLDKLGINGVPKEIRQFLAICAGHLTYRGVKEASNDTSGGLRNEIVYTCIGYRFGNQQVEPLVVNLRNLSIYKNRTFDDYMRMAGPRYPKNLVKSPGKFVGMHFRRLAQGLARTQAISITKIIEEIRNNSVQEAFSNGLLSSFLLSNLVELDSAKIVSSEVYHVLHPNLTRLVQTYFGDRRYLPVSEDVIPWSAGTRGHPIMHIVKPTTTYGICVTVNPKWFAS